ncbi:24375_t:CDS:2, partial [Racocetra persica]
LTGFWFGRIFPSFKKNVPVVACGNFGNVRNGMFSVVRVGASYGVARLKDTE